LVRRIQASSSSIILRPSTEGRRASSGTAAAAPASDAPIASPSPEAAPVLPRPAFCCHRRGARTNVTRGANASLSSRDPIARARVEGGEGVSRKPERTERFVRQNDVIKNDDNNARRVF
jgi:hypothetical protein